MYVIEAANKNTKGDNSKAMAGRSSRVIVAASSKDPSSRLISFRLSRYSATVPRAKQAPRVIAIHFMNALTIYKVTIRGKFPSNM